MALRRLTTLRGLGLLHERALRVSGTGWRPLVYALAIGATVVTLAVSVSIRRTTDVPALLLFIVPVVLAAYAGGFGPALAATVVGVATSAFFLLPPFSTFTIAQSLDTMRLGFLGGIGLLVSVIGGFVRRDRLRAEASERRLLRVLDATSEGMWDWDLVTDKIVISARWLESLGYDRGDLETGAAVWEAIVHPDDLPAVRRELQRHMTGETSHYQSLNRLRKKSGEYRWNLARGTVVERSAAGRAVRMIGTDTDVTERRQAEDALRESEDRLQMIVENLSEGVIVSDGSGELIHWNRAGLQMHGFTALDDRLCQLSRFREIFELWTLDGTLVPFEDWPLHRILRGEQIRNLDLCLRRRDIEWERIFSYGGAIVRDPAGRLLAVLTITDLTTRKRAEQALAASEERFRQLAENIREVFWLVDTAEGQLLYVSPAYEAIWGRSCESLYANPRDWMEWVHPEDQDRVRTIRERGITATYNEEYRVARPDGSVRWIHDQAFPVYDASGTLIRLAGVAEDITERRHLEAQVRQTQKMESIGRLAGGVAHDFNNWLTVISGCTDLISEMLTSNPEAVELLAEIKHAGERAGSLTRQLLAFSRREVLEPRLLDLNTVVADTQKMLGRVLGEDIVLSAVLSPGVGRVRIDSGQWVQILMNLAVNARDAMPTGGQLTIETKDVVLDEEYAKLHPPVEAGRHVLLAVSDTGCGMTADIASRVFEPFFTTKPVGEGTGLGLSVVHGIVEQSGGHIEVYSEPGRGTTFKLLLPVVEAAPDAIAPRDTAAGRIGTETLLLVEDEDTVRRVTSRILRRYGFTVLEASSGQAALEVLEQERGRVSLLITDVVMPHMDGRKLAELVGVRYPEVKVLYTSGYTADAVVRHGVLHAHVAFLQKPHSSQMLVEKIREVLDRP